MAGPKPLSPKQLKFVEFYLGGKSAAQAYTLAGYKAKRGAAKTNGPRLLQHPAVAAAVAAARERGKDKAGITAEWWWGRLKGEATRKRSPAAARVAALRIIGQAAGYVTESVKVSGDKENPVRVEGSHEHHATLPTAAVVAGVLRDLGVPLPGPVRADGAGKPVDQEGAGDAAGRP